MFIKYIIYYFYIYNIIMTNNSNGNTRKKNNITLKKKSQTKFGGARSRTWRGTRVTPVASSSAEGGIEGGAPEGIIYDSPDYQEAQRRAGVNR